MPALRPAARLVLSMVAVLCAAGMVARLAFAAAFAPADLPPAGLADGLWLGLRFDLRVAVLTVLPLWLLNCLPGVASRLRPPRGRATWRALWLLACAVWLVAWVLDAGHHAYLGQRLSAVLVSLAADPREAAGMVWQSYPVLPILAGLALGLLLAAGAFRTLWSRHAMPQRPQARRWTVGAEAVVVLLALFAVHGRVSQYPLRWSDAIELDAPFARQLALNPLQNLVDTWAFRTQQLDEAGMRPDADAIRAFVGLPPLRPGEPVSFLRTVAPTTDQPPNVVVVLLESFAGHKVGALGSPMGATPAFDALAAEGLLFTRMMSAHGHTARGVFATLTGIPDVSLQSTASRNPAATRQQVIANEFTDHDKFYFIGGSTSWANVRGLLTASIDGLEIYEEGRLLSPSEDVWGVSDRNLFREAHAVFRTRRLPFFAVIQTSGNHRPYTVPEADRAQFEPPVRSEAELKAHGFVSAAEYEAFAYLDWCIGQFMADARQEPYFANTVFAFVGDHGIVGPTGPHVPRAWHDLAITQGHTPLLIVAPGRVTPRRVDHWAQQVDVLPTVASLAGIGYRNTTLGRDLLDPAFDASRVAFTFQFGGPGQPGVLVGDRYLVDRPPLAVHDILAAEPGRDLAASPSADTAALVAQWGRFPRAYANAALFLQTHNRRLGGRPDDDAAVAARSAP